MAKSQIRLLFMIATQIWCSGRDLNPGLRLSSVKGRKAGILGPAEFNLAIFGRRGALSFLLPEPRPEHHAIIGSFVLTFLRFMGNMLCRCIVSATLRLRYFSTVTFSFLPVSKISSPKKGFRRVPSPQLTRPFQDAVPLYRHVKCL